MRKIFTILARQKLFQLGSLLEEPFKRNKAVLFTQLRYGLLVPRPSTLEEYSLVSSAV